jgi:hypothetical protein
MCFGIRQMETVPAFGEAVARPMIGSTILGAASLEV